MPYSYIDIAAGFENKCCFKCAKNKNVPYTVIKQIQMQIHVSEATHKNKSSCIIYVQTSLMTIMFTLFLFIVLNIVDNNASIYCH